MLLQHVDCLIEQVQTQGNNKTPNSSVLLGQNLAASVVPAIVTTQLLSGPVKDSLIKSGVSNTNIAGVSNLSPSDIATTGITSLASMGTAALARTLLKKYQERKYGIYKTPDQRTISQKATDTGLNIAQRAVSIGSNVAAKAALATALGPAAATSALAIPAFMVAGAVANTPIKLIQQKIQQKRMQEQQNSH